jgi:predicted metal-dependent phosphoesterase TrpH
MVKFHRIETHCHTIFSKDSLTRPATLLDASQRKGLDRVIITDHNTLAGAVAAQKLAPDRVILGEEIMTQAGELLAAFVKEEIPPGLTPLETITRLRAQGAFISVSHPFDVTRSGHWKLADLLAIAPLVDAIEVFNARCFSAKMDEQAQVFATQHGLLGTVGSDAHTAYELGTATLELPPFSDAEGLRQSLRHARSRVRRSPAWVRLASRYAVFAKFFVNPSPKI